MPAKTKKRKKWDSEAHDSHGICAPFRAWIACDASARTAFFDEKFQSKHSQILECIYERPEKHAATHSKSPPKVEMRDRRVGKTSADEKRREIGAQRRRMTFGVVLTPPTAAARATKPPASVSPFHRIGHAFDASRRRSIIDARVVQRAGVGTSAVHHAEKRASDIVRGVRFGARPEYERRRQGQSSTSGVVKGLVLR